VVEERDAVKGVGFGKNWGTHFHSAALEVDAGHSYLCFILAASQKSNLGDTNKCLMKTKLSQYEGGVTTDFEH